MRLRAALAVHRRLAVVLGLWVAFQSLTGLVLVFRDPIEHRAHPGLTRHGHGDQGAAAVLDAVRLRYPGEVVGALATPAVSDGVYVVEVGERDVYVDPARARVNGSRDHEAGFTGLVARLHRRFLFDSLFGLPGARLVALLGFGWLVLAVTGLTTAAAGRIGVWWRRGRLTGRCPGDQGCPPDSPGGRSFPPEGSRPLSVGARRTPHVLHRTIGFVVVAPMVLVVVTGIRLAVPAGSDRIWAAVTGSGHGRYDAPPKKVVVTSDDRGGDPMDATRMLEALHRKYPDGLVARLLMPSPGDRTAPVIAGVSLGLDPGRGQHDYGGNTVVFLDQFSGDTLWVGRPQSLPAARQAAVLWTRPLHTGSFAGTPGTLVWGWLAIALVALAAAGYATRRVRTVAARLETWRSQRQLRRRKVLARQERVRAGRAARQRRRRGRRLRRRRMVQARTRAVAVAVDRTDPVVGTDRTGPVVGTDRTGPVVGTDRTEPVLEIDLKEPAVEIDLKEPAVEIDLTEPAVEIDLTEPAVEIDLTEPALEIDLTEPAVTYESEITLETGETLESGIVACLPHR